MKKTVLVIFVICLGLFLLSLRNKTKRAPWFDNPMMKVAFKAAGLSDLHVAALNQDSETLSELISKGADVNALSADGTSALHPVAAFGYVDCVKILLDNGANIDLKDARGDTPLSLAAVAGQPDIVEILLEYGASTDVRNREGRTPLQAVINFKKILSSNAIMDKTSQSLKKRLDECAEILKKHEDK